MALTDEGLIDVPGLYSRWAQLPNGARAHYVTAGESGPSVVLLHGGITGSSGTAGWRFMAPFLGENGFRVYCPDQPGFGLTEGGDLYHPSAAGHIDFIHDFVNALCLDRFFIGGNSQGCQNAISYVTAHPERIIAYAVIASGTSLFGLISDADRKAADTRPDEVKKRGSARNFDGSEASMKEMMDQIIYRAEAVSEDLLKMRTLAANRNAELFAKRKAYTANPDPNVEARLNLKGRFDKIELPGIYLFGRQDVTAPVDVAYLQEDALPNLQMFYPDECGHQGQTDQPEMFNQVFLEFFRDGKVSSKTAEWAGVSERRPVNSNLVG